MPRTLVASIGAVLVSLIVAFVWVDPSSFLSVSNTPHQRRELLQEPQQASFQGVPVVYHNGPPRHSTTHCIGESFTENDWLYRSCQFRNLCWDASRNDFVLFPSPQEQRLHALQRQDVTLSSVAQSSKRLSLGAIDPMDNKAQFQQLHDSMAWFPTVVTERSDSGYYQLDDSYVMVPFLESVPTADDSIRQKDWLSIFALLYNFGLENQKLLLVRQPGLVVVSESLPELLQRHLPAMGIASERAPMIAAATPRLEGTQQSSSLVCAKYAAAGLGMLMTGTRPVQDAQGSWMYTHTVGRDATLKAFDAHTQRNLERLARNEL